MPRSLTVFLLILLSRAVLPAEDAGGYVWPLDADPALTSSFAEFRKSWRFHAGIDLKTWGGTGQRVFATDSAEVFRLRVSPYGYGKAVYLHMPDGTYQVYAHLEDFAPRIKERVRATQERSGSFRVDLYLKPGELIVSRGECIGYAGRSGIRWPHLHFEVRDASHHPLDPLERGFDRIKDTTPPHVARLLVRPLSAGSTVDGEETYGIYRFARDNVTGRYRLEAPIRITGTVGLAVSSYDKADAADNLLNVKQLGFAVDGAFRFRTVYDRFAYSENKQVRYDRDYQAAAHDEGIFQKLYRDAGNRLSLYTYPDSSRGTVSAGRLGPGTHHAAITLADVHGNTAFADVDLVVNTPPRITEVSVIADSLVRVAATDPDDSITGVDISFLLHGPSARLVRSVSTAPGGIFTAVLPPAGRNVTLHIVARDARGVHSLPYYHQPLTAQPSDTAQPFITADTVVWEDSSLVWDLTAAYLSPRLPVAVCIPDGKSIVGTRTPRRHRYLARLPQPYSAAGTLTLVLEYARPDGSPARYERILPFRRMLPDSTGTAVSGDSMLTVDWKSGATFRPLTVTLHRSAAGEAPDSIIPVTDRYTVLPGDMPLEKGVSVTLNVPPDLSDTARTGLYSVWGENSWSCIATGFSAASRKIRAGVSAFGTYALAVDRACPKIDDFSIADGESLDDPRPLITAEVTDEGSGFDDLSMTFTLDGQDVIFEWDPPIRTVLYQVEETLAPGSHTVFYSVRDLAGNETSHTVTFTVAESAK